MNQDKKYELTERLKVIETEIFDKKTDLNAINRKLKMVCLSCLELADNGKVVCDVANNEG